MSFIELFIMAASALHLWFALVLVKLMAMCTILFIKFLKHDIVYSVSLTNRKADMPRSFAVCIA